jgi:trehalose 6-phosphate phosphatase
MRASALSCLIDRLAAGTKRLLVATDFDGTLCPITDSPSDVAIPPVILEILIQLSLSQRVAFTVISGRALDDLVRRVPLQKIILAGNYGLAVRGPALSFEHPEARKIRPQLAEACAHLGQVVAASKGAWVEDKVLTAAVHYRNVDRSERYALMRNVRHCMAPYGTLFGMRAGRKVIEIIPRLGWDKGSCLGWVRHKLNMERDGCICIGDDPTDESMFVANASQLNIRVGPVSHTVARYHVGDVFEVAAVLAHVEHAVRTHNLERDDLAAVSLGNEVA